MSNIQPVSGSPLPKGTHSSPLSQQVEWERRYVLHASAGVYTPAPGGGVYTNTATCTHDHPDTEAGLEATRDCAARLRKIIESGRLPKWATLTNPLPTTENEA